jgi:hypothetical protein
VLGMHRSGTSLLAQMLFRLGVRLGEDVLTRGEDDNKYGYWEHRGIAMTQDFLLAELGRMWHEPRGLLPLPRGWLEAEATKRAMATLDGIVGAELETARGAAWAFKDPRTIRLLPMWQQIFAARNITPTYILALRAPDSVAASLMARNRMPSERALFLWSQHTLEPFRLGLRMTTQIDYDSWFNAPRRNVAKLLRVMGSAQKLEHALSICAPLLDRNERHHNFAASDSVADRIYRALMQPAPALVKRYQLRRVAAEFDRASELLSAWEGAIEECHPVGPLPVDAWRET